MGDPSRVLLVRNLIVTASLALAAPGCTPLKKVDLNSATVDDVARICAMLTSCSFIAGGPGDSGFALTCINFGQSLLADSQRVTVRLPPFDHQFACVLTATNCASLASCLSRGRPSDWCATHGELTCDGNVLVDCAGHTTPSLGRGVPVAMDCGAAGMICRADRGRCTTDHACESNTCQGRTLIACDNHFEFPYDCSWVFGGDSTCTVQNGKTDCSIPTELACSGPSRCEGDTAIKCKGGATLHADCRRIFESTCRAPGDGGSPEASCAMPATAECDSNSLLRCNGSSLEICINGRRHAVDCASIGFRTCSSTVVDGGANGSTRTSCTN